jgi:hypothetical protein
MRRATIGLVCAFMLLASAACKSSTTQTAAQVEPPPSGTLCERVQATLAGSWKAEAAEPWLYNPISETCSLIDTAQSSHRIRVGLSVLPVTAAEFAQLRRSAERNLASSGYLTTVIDGGIGTESWAVGPAAASPWVVFRHGTRIVRLKEDADGLGGLDELRAVAKAITVLPGGLPTVNPVVERPECTRGTSAAEKALGGRAVVRLDSLVGGIVYCQWATARDIIFVGAGGVGSDPALDFTYLRQAGTPATTTVRRVDVGTEGWQDMRTSYAGYRIGTQTYVSVMSESGKTTPASVLAVARAVAPPFGG